MKHGDSRSDGEVLDTQGEMTVHLVGREQCPAQHAPLGKSDSLVFPCREDLQCCYKVAGGNKARMGLKKPLF